MAKRFGYISIRKRSSKIARANRRSAMGPGGSAKVRKLGVKVYVQRGNSPTSNSYGGGYWAWACLAHHEKSGDRTRLDSLGAHRQRGCADSVFGKTPTAATKKALIALGKKKELR
jgi:hypothetical protein